MPGNTDPEQSSQPEPNIDQSQHDEQQQNQENNRDENQSWRLNIEINSDVLGQARNLNQEDWATLRNTLRQLYNTIGVVYFVSLY